MKYSTTVTFEWKMLIDRTMFTYTFTQCSPTPLSPNAYMHPISSYFPMLTYTFLSPNAYLQLSPNAYLHPYLLMLTWPLSPNAYLHPHYPMLNLHPYLPICRSVGSEAIIFLRSERGHLVRIMIISRLGRVKMMYSSCQLSSAFGRPSAVLTQPLQIIFLHHSNADYTVAGAFFPVSTSAVHISHRLQLPTAGQ